MPALAACKKSLLDKVFYNILREGFIVLIFAVMSELNVALRFDYFAIIMPRNNSL